MLCSICKLKSLNNFLKIHAVFDLSDINSIRKVQLTPEQTFDKEF